MIRKEIKKGRISLPCVAPLRLVALGASQAVVEVESVNVERYALCHICDVAKIKKPSSDGHVHSRKNGGA